MVNRSAIFRLWQGSQIPADAIGCSKFPIHLQLKNGGSDELFVKGADSELRGQVVGDAMLPVSEAIGVVQRNAVSLSNEHRT
jgi:hypothetical protein